MHLVALSPLAAAALLAAPVAHAEGNPWALGSSLNLIHDSNVLRAPGALAQSDTIATLGVQGQLDQRFGRQHLLLDARLDRSQYQDRSDLDYTGFKVNARLDFEPGERLFGALTLDSTQVAFNYDPASGNTPTAQNLERTHRLALRMKQGVVTRWTLEGGFDALRRDESTPDFAYRELQRDSADLGVRYQHSPDLSVGALVRHSWGRYPNVGATGDDFRRTDLEASATWQVSGASALDLRLTGGSEHHTPTTTRSFSRWSGSAQWRWQPTGKLSLSTRLARDSDTGSNDTVLLGTYSDARVRTTLELSGVWQATSKVRAFTQLSASRRSLDASLQAQSLGAGHDTTQIARLGLDYQMLRNFSLGCSLAREKRDVSGNSLGLSYAYAATTGSCFAQIWLR
ncbi:MAG: outer membrane beta-barrel protein [Burkholderiales bacterium]|nr:outer membrane beta-barrel protein [Burkholderiales bacterium]